MKYVSPNCVVYPIIAGHSPYDEVVIDMMPIPNE